MKISKEETYDVGRVHNRVLREVLEKDLEKHLNSLKLNSDYIVVRWEQGYINVLEEILKIIKK